MKLEEALSILRKNPGKRAKLNWLKDEWLFFDGDGCIRYEKGGTEHRLIIYAEDIETDDWEIEQ